VERHKATLKIRKITRKSHTKLHIYSSEPKQNPCSDHRRPKSPLSPPLAAAAPIDPARSKLCAGTGKERRQEAGAARRPVNPSQQHPERRKRREKPETPGSPRTRDAAGDEEEED